MIRTPFYFSIFCCVLLCLSLHAQSFEGVITMTKYEADTQRVVTYTVKGDMVLVTMPTRNGPVRIINNRAEKILTSLFESDGKKYAYINRIEDEVDEPLDERQKKIFELIALEVEMEMTGETRQIGPYRCTKIVGRDHKHQIEAWVNPGIKLSLYDLFPHKQSPEAERVDVQKMIWEQGFVLEYWTKSRKTGEVSKITYSLAEQPVATELFTYARDEYREFDNETLSELYAEAAKDPAKMEELRVLLRAFDTGN